VVLQQPQNLSGADAYGRIGVVQQPALPFDDDLRGPRSASFISATLVTPLARKTAASMRQ